MTDCGSSLLSRPVISTASAMGPPRTVLRRYCKASSPRSPARLATCSASSRKLQRLNRVDSCSIVVCGKSFRTFVNPAATCRARKASSTKSGTRSSMPIFERKLRAIPGRCVSTPATKSSACSIAGKYRLLDAQPDSQMPQRFAEQFGVSLGIQLGHLGEPDGGLLPRIGVFAFRALRIILKDADGFRDISMLDQFGDVGLHVARRNAPRLPGHQHGTFAALRHRCPELPV